MSHLLRALHNFLTQSLPPSIAGTADNYADTDREARNESTARAALKRARTLDKALRRTRASLVAERARRATLLRRLEATQRRLEAVRLYHSTGRDRDVYPHQHPHLVAHNAPGTVRFEMPATPQ